MHASVAVGTLMAGVAKALHERFLCATDPFGNLSGAHQG